MEKFKTSQVITLNFLKCQIFTSVLSYGWIIFLPNVIMLKKIIYWISQYLYNNWLEVRGVMFGTVPLISYNSQPMWRCRSLHDRIGVWMYIWMIQKSVLFPMYHVIMLNIIIILSNVMLVTHKTFSSLPERPWKKKKYVIFSSPRKMVRHLKSVHSCAVYLTWNQIHFHIFFTLFSFK